VTFEGHTCVVLPCWPLPVLEWTVLEMLLLRCVFSLLSWLCSALSAALLEPCCDPATDSCMAVLCALNKAEPPAGCSVLYEHTFTQSDW